MTSATFQTPGITAAPAATTTQSSGSMKSTAIGALDSIGSFASTVDKTLDSVASTVNEAVPATTRFVLSILPVPEAVNNVIVGVTSAVTRVATWTTRLVADAALQTVTFGAPAWSQAARQGVAVSGATDSLETNESSREFLARCIAESAAAPAVRSSLTSYLDLRGELSAAQKSGNSEKITELSERIAKLEVSLREYQEFRDFKSALEHGPKFVEAQHEKITALAATTADAIIARVENYYKTTVSGDRETVKGKWSEQSSPEERDAMRNRLKKQIAARLHTVFTKELSSQATMAEIEKVGSDLHEAFGTYRMGFKAAMGSLLGASAVTGALSTALTSAWAGAQQVAARASAWLGGVGAGIGAMVVNKVKETVTKKVNEAVAPIADAIKGSIETVAKVPEKVGEAAETAAVAVEVTKDKVADKINDVGAAAFPPTQAVQEPSIMQVRPEGIMRGESTISGLPSPGTGPSVEPSAEKLGELFGVPASSAERTRAQLRVFASDFTQ